MELWQMDVVGGFVLADGTKAKALTGSMTTRGSACRRISCRGSRTRASVRGTRRCDADLWGARRVLTDNGKVFTGRFNQPPAEVLFDRICRENGVTHRLTQPRSPTTTGKIERFHRSLRIEFRTGRVFRTEAAHRRARRVGGRLQHGPAPPGIGMVPPADGSPNSPCPR